MLRERLDAKRKFQMLREDWLVSDAKRKTGC